MDEDKPTINPSRSDLRMQHVQRIGATRLYRLLGQAKEKRRGYGVAGRKHTKRYDWTKFRHAKRPPGSKLLRKVQRREPIVDQLSRIHDTAVFAAKCMGIGPGGKRRKSLIGPHRQR